jgi:hypothetical protein
MAADEDDDGLEVDEAMADNLSEPLVLLRMET